MSEHCFLMTNKDETCPALIQMGTDQEGSKLVMGLGQKFLTRVRSIFCGQVRSGQPLMVWVLVRKSSPKNVKFFNFFPSDKKKSLLVGSKSIHVMGG